MLIDAGNSFKVDSLLVKARLMFMIYLNRLEIACLQVLCMVALAICFQFGPWLIEKSSALLKPILGSLFFERVPNIGFK